MGRVPALEGRADLGLPDALGRRGSGHQPVPAPLELVREALVLALQLRGGRAQFSEDRWRDPEERLR
jgi:hypothetical protein